MAKKQKTEINEISIMIIQDSLGHLGGYKLHGNV